MYIVAHKSKELKTDFQAKSLLKPELATQDK